MTIQLKFRRGTAAEWTTANPVLAAGELGIETDTDQFKLGDGTTAWNSLGYGGLQGPAGADGATGAGVPAGGAAGEYLVKDSATDFDTSWTDRVNARTIYENVKNVSGGTLTKGTPVYQVGITGNTITVGAADANRSNASDPQLTAIGLLDETLANEAEGRMIVLGEIKGINTAGFSPGDRLFLAQGGGYTNAEPVFLDGDPSTVQFLGVVNRVDATNGSAFITGTLAPEKTRFRGEAFFVDTPNVGWQSVGFRYRGSWDSAQTYYFGDVVLDGDLTWRCQFDNEGSGVTGAGDGPLADSGYWHPVSPPRQNWRLAGLSYIEKPDLDGIYQLRLNDLDFWRLSCNDAGGPLTIQVFNSTPKLNNLIDTYFWRKTTVVVEPNPDVGPYEVVWELYDTDDNGNPTTLSATPIQWIGPEVTGVGGSGTDPIIIDFYNFNHPNSSISKTYAVVTNRFNGDLYGQFLRDSINEQIQAEQRFQIWGTDIPTPNGDRNTPHGFSVRCLGGTNYIPEQSSPFAVLVDNGAPNTNGYFSKAYMVQDVVDPNRTLTYQSNGTESLPYHVQVAYFNGEVNNSNPQTPTQNYYTATNKLVRDPVAQAWRLHSGIYDWVVTPQIQISGSGYFANDRGIYDGLPRNTQELHRVVTLTTNNSTIVPRSFYTNNGLNGPAFGGMIKNWMIRVAPGQSVSTAVFANDGTYLDAHLASYDGPGGTQGQYTNQNRGENWQVNIWFEIPSTATNSSVTITNITPAPGTVEIRSGVFLNTAYVNVPSWFDSATRTATLTRPSSGVRFYRLMWQRLNDSYVIREWETFDV